MKKWMGYAVVILWLAAAVKYIAEPQATGEVRVMEAFTRSDFQEAECGLRLAGYLSGEAYGDAREEALLREVAERLDLKTGYQFQRVETDGTRIVELFKEMPEAKVSIRIVTVNPEREEVRSNYLYVGLDFFQSPASGLYYKEKLEELADEYGMDTSVTLTLTGVYEGDLNREARNIVSDQLLGAMGAREQEAYKSEELYTVYAYTENWQEHTVINGKKVNINLAFSYDEEQNKTFVYLGSPLILDEY
ncbi:MAG: hypothetical protein HFI93_01820 [Lachnospiraceae bacterium]|nr:hypothetical protein [Lachnospiraceae bacterium]